MAYRPFKRVIGETSLERKCRFLFGICLLLLITGSFWWYGRQTDELVYGANRRAGKLLVDTILAQHHWIKLEALVQLNDNNWEPKQLADALQTVDYDWRPILPRNASSDIGPRDPFERDLLAMWQRVGQGILKEGEEPPIYSERSVPGEHIYQYYQPIFAHHEYCVTCHRITGLAPDPNMQKDDLVAVIQVSFSDLETVRARNWNRATLLATAIIAVFLAMVALYIIVRYVIVKPLTHLTDVSDEISRGNMQRRAEIKTGDEFEQLGEAFNRMLRHMINAQEELRGLNRSLDSKVDELAQANMRLYDMNRLKTDFLATVSHELRTPLNSIIGFSDVLLSNDNLDDKQRRYTHNIQRSGRMLLEMINDILDLNKIESGKMEVRLSEFKIDVVIATQCELARPLAEKKNIDLEYHVEPDLPDLLQDQSKVQQILNNLLSNAIKFTPEGGRITVSGSRSTTDQLQLVVSDTGVGIADEDRVAVFEKFRQGAAVLSGGDAITREYSGTGLGLSIVKELCRLLGGEVSLQSELGKGSTFTVRLPWTRTVEPQLDSPLNDELEELTKPRRLELPGPAGSAVSTS